MLETVLLSLVAALISLDITAFGQLMISRPIVCAPIFGYLLGDINAGLWLGMITELLWVNAIPMGAAVPHDTTCVAILSTVWGLSFFPAERSSMMFALIIAVPAGWAFKRLDIFMRYVNVKIAHWVEKGLREGREDRIWKGVFSGLAVSFLKAFVFYMVLIVPGKLFMTAVFAQLTKSMIVGLESAWFLLPMIGFGYFLINFQSGKLPGSK